ncbi:MAG TPA: DUF983 domain-containing protein [Parasegetibacter sp.]|jgi:uncharacterized protein (DUF983 family)
MDHDHSKRSYLASIFGCYCPRCREGKMFQNKTAIRLEKNLKLNKNCPVCGQPTEIEPGFYYGTAYVSYALTVAISVATFVAWVVLIGMSLQDNRFIGWLILNGLLLLVLQPWLMRISRSLWISWFVKYDPDWRTNKIKEEELERIIPEQMLD